MRFKKGQKSWNEGTKGVMKANSGSFKKGRIAGNKKVWIEKSCLKCGKHFSVKPSLERVKHCSQSCAQKGKVGSAKQREAVRLIGLKNTGKRPLITGEKHYLWVADRSQLKDERRDRGGQLSREWGRQVKNRDYWKCQISNDDCSGRVEAHHILGWKSYPELRYQIKNGITLCHFHHPRKRVDEERYAADFQKLVAAKMQ